VATLQQSRHRNRLLALMSAEDYALLAPQLEPVKLAKGFTLVEAGAEIEHVYFFESGLASIVATSPEGQEVEAGIYGRDGVGPLAVLMGSDQSVHHSLVQVPDDAYRIRPAAVIEAMDCSAGLRSLIMRFALILNTQTSFTALSNAVHQIDERLARWLLMCHDRHDSDDIPLTHEFLSLMLAVRRPSVTTSLHVLEGNGFIRNERGWINIRNRLALEEFAHDAYGIPEAEYRRLIGPMSPS
jgi:CRP-like cAMP-binding protein